MAGAIQSTIGSGHPSSDPTTESPAAAATSRPDQ